MPETADDPRREYETRLGARRAEAEAQERRHIALGNARLAVAVLAGLIALLAFGRHVMSGWWLLAPVPVFVALAVVHARVLRAQKRAERSARFYERGLKRLDDDWFGTGETGERFADPLHPYAEDLDLFGNGSLFQLLSLARLRTGEETLARWLSGPAAPGEVEARQSAIGELRTRLDLREDTAMLGEEIQSGINPGALSGWAEQPLLFDSPALRRAASALAALAVAGLVVWAILGIPEFFLIVFLAEYIRVFACTPPCEASGRKRGRPRLWTGAADWSPGALRARAVRESRDWSLCRKSWKWTAFRPRSA